MNGPSAAVVSTPDLVRHVWSGGEVMSVTVNSGEKAPKTGTYRCLACGDAKYVHMGDTVPPCNNRGCAGTWYVP